MKRKDILRQTHCILCGEPLVHRVYGKRKRFCGSKCRVYYGRYMTYYAKQCNKAVFAGETEPKSPFYPVSLAYYECLDNGDTKKREG